MVLIDVEKLLRKIVKWNEGLEDDKLIVTICAYLEARIDIAEEKVQTMLELEPSIKGVRGKDRMKKDMNDIKNLLKHEELPLTTAEIAEQIAGINHEQCYRTLIKLEKLKLAKQTGYSGRSHCWKLVSHKSPDPLLTDEMTKYDTVIQKGSLES